MDPTAKMSTKKSKNSLQSQHSTSILNLGVPIKKSKTLPKLPMPDNLPAIREQTEIQLRGSDPTPISAKNLFQKRSSPLAMSTNRLEMAKVNSRTKLPKLSKSYKSIVRSQPSLNNSTKKFSASGTFESVDDDDLESVSNKLSFKSNKKLGPIKMDSPTNRKLDSRVSSNSSSKSSRSIKITKKKVSMQTANKIEPDKQDAPELDQFEPYEDFMKRVERESIPTRVPSPIYDSIWPSEWHEPVVKRVDPLEKLNLRIGSIFSEDANYAMLKTYEDMIYYDLMSIYPETKANKLERMKTEIFKRVPRKFSSKNKLPDINKSPLVVLPNIPKKEVLSMNTSKSSENDNNHQLNKHKYMVSRQLESAMKISDVVRKAKGQFVPCADRIKTKNPLIEYNHWKTNWNNYILNN